MIKKILNAIKSSARQAPTSVLGAGWMMGGNWDWDDMMGFGFGESILTGMLMILFWIIVIMAGLAFLRWLANGNIAGNINTSSKAMEILKEKYAKGEITKEEFETKKKDIMM